MSGVARGLAMLASDAMRLTLAAAFGFAAYLKLQDPQSMAFAIQAYEVIRPADLGEATAGHLLRVLAYGVPWVEACAAVALLLGVWTRGAAGLVAVLLLAFTAAYASVIFRGLDVACSCFGKAEVVCSGNIGWCHVGRNVAMLGMAVAVALIGPGWLALDRLGPDARGRDDDAPTPGGRAAPAGGVEAPRGGA